MGGKSKSVTVGYKYFVGQHHICCHGPIDNFSRITVDERVAWTGEATGGQITINAPELFGGESREGGVSGTVDIEMGEPDQMQNSYLVAQLGSDVPAYRGVAGAVLRQCYLGNNPYLKGWAYRGTRVHVRQDGITQWYNAKAAIQGAAVMPYNSTWEYQGTPIINNAPASVPSGGWSGPAPAPFGDGSGFGAPYPIATEWEASSGIWLRRTINWPFGGPMTIHGHVENSCYIYFDGALVHSVNPGNSQVTSLQEWSVTVPSVDAGEHEIAIFASDDNSAGINTYIYADIPDQVDMNPAHVIRECLTDPDWGMGYQDADIDADSFEAAADQLFIEQLGISLLWDRQMTLEAFIGEVVKHIDAALYVSRVTGKFILKLIRDDYDPDDLLVFDQSNIAKITNPKTPAFSDLTNSVTVKFWNAATGKDDAITLQDPALVIMQGRVIPTTVQYPGFTNSRNGSIAGQRDLRSLSFPLFSCTIYANREAKDLNIGDVFKLNWAPWRISNMIMRVMALAFGDGKSSQVRITCVQDVFSTPLIEMHRSSGGAWIDPSRPPSPSPDSLAGEAPYLELLQSLGEGAINSDIAGNPDLSYVFGAAPRSTSAINARMWTDNGSGYQDTSGLDFCPYAVLDADVVQTTTVFQITGMQDLDQVEIGTWCQIGDELMRVDAIDEGDGELTVGRGVLDTVPVRHEAGAAIFFWDSFNGYDPTEYVSGEEIDVKIQPVSGAGVVALDAIEAQTVTLVGRANRPYAPGDLEIEGESYAVDAVYEGELSVTWVHRDRLQQTGGVLADHFDGSIGPEEGTTYRMRTYIDDFLVDEQDEIAGTSATVTPGLSGICRIEVSAKRDDLYSYQAATHEFVYTGGSALRAVEDSDNYRMTESGNYRGTED